MHVCIGCCSCSAHIQSLWTMPLISHPKYRIELHKYRYALSCLVQYSFLEMNKCRWTNTLDLINTILKMYLSMSRRAHTILHCINLVYVYMSIPVPLNMFCFVYINRGPPNINTPITLLLVSESHTHIYICVCMCVCVIWIPATM